MAHKTLLFRVDSEIASLVMAIEWTPELLAQIETRRKAATVLAEDPSFHRASFFWYGMDVYTLTDEIEDLLDEDGTPALVDSPPLSDDNRERVDVCQMALDEENILFTFYLKHTSVELETSTVSFDDEEFFSGMTPLSHQLNKA